MGVAPLFFLAKKIIEVRGQKSEVRKPVVLIGGRTKEHILREREFKDLGCDVHIATEDGSKGHHGRVTDLLKELLAASCAPQVIEKKDLKLKASGKEPVATICACGPKPMLAAIADIARVKEISAQVSLEEFMGCGLGACLGCVISTTSGYKRICHDGPVFDAGEVIWKE
jgi:dihydroorotate dehydrogenase electron transfer subunit